MATELLEQSGGRTRKKQHTEPSAAANRYVDMWGVPGLHPTNVDIVQKLRTAEDRQFGANMDTCGTASDRGAKSKGWEKTHLVGVRTDIWKPSEKDRKRALNTLKKKRKEQIRREIKKNGRLSKDQKLFLDSEVARDETMNMDAGDVDKSRLVLKLFRTTGQNIRWIGTIEEMTSHEIHNSLGTKHPMLSFALNLSGYDYVTWINQNHRTFRIPAVFTFSYFDEKHERMWYIEIKRKWFSLGRDFIVEAQGKQIGFIDGKLLTIGSDSHLYIYEPTLASDNRFMDLLTLFAASVGYHRAIRRNIKRRIKAIASDDACHMIEDEEFSLLKNPRRRTH